MKLAYLFFALLIGFNCIGQVVVPAPGNGGKAKKAKPASARENAMEAKCRELRSNIELSLKRFDFDAARMYYNEWVARANEYKCELDDLQQKIALINTMKVLHVYPDGTAQVRKVKGNELLVINSNYEPVSKPVTEITIDNEFYEGNFTGQLVDGKPNGKGKIDGTNNLGVKFIYEGDLVNGLAQGSGKVTLPNGDVYEGEWNDGYRNGKGRYTWAQRYNGLYFVGEWKNDVVQKGKFYNSDNTENSLYVIRQQ